jgi:hypothetical protein
LDAAVAGLVCLLQKKHLGKVLFVVLRGKIREYLKYIFVKGAVGPSGITPHTLNIQTLTRHTQEPG